MKSMNNMNLLELWRSVISDVVSADRPDLTLRQQAILLNVYLRPQPHTVRGLAHSLNITKPGVTRALDTLSSLDLVKRKKDPNDLRNVLVQRTVKGSVFLSEFSDMIRDAADEMNAQDPEDRAAA